MKRLHKGLMYFFDEKYWANLSELIVRKAKERGSATETGTTRLIISQVEQLHRRDLTDDRIEVILDTLHNIKRKSTGGTTCMTVHVDGIVDMINNFRKGMRMYWGGEQLGSYSLRRKYCMKLALERIKSTPDECGLTRKDIDEIFEKLMNTL